MLRSYKNNSTINAIYIGILAGKFYVGTWAYERDLPSGGMVVGTWLWVGQIWNLYIFFPIEFSSGGLRPDVRHVRGMVPQASPPHSTTLAMLLNMLLYIDQGTAITLSSMPYIQLSPIS